MSGSRRRKVIGSALVLALGGAGLVLASERKWERTPSKSGGDPLALPAGRETILETPDGATLSVLVVGEGKGVPEIVLSHCWTGDRRIWAPVVRYLVEEGFRVLLYDQRGHGSSTLGSRGTTIEAIADDLELVLAHFKLKGIVLAGHSMGGMTVQAFAGRHPEAFSERVRGVVLVSTASQTLSFAGGLVQEIGATLVGSGKVENALRGEVLGPLLLRWTIGRGASARDVNAVIETFVNTPVETREGFWNAMATMDLTSAARAITVPTVVMAGTRDLLIPLALDQRLARTIPGARLEVIPGAGHMLPLEVPQTVSNAISAMARSTKRSARKVQGLRLVSDLPAEEAAPVPAPEGESTSNEADRR